MASRRLTISSLLCADEQATDQSQDSQPPPSVQPDPLYQPVLSGPGVPPPEDHRGLQHPYPPISRHGGRARSRTTSGHARDSHNTVPLSLQPARPRRHTPSPPADDAVTYHKTRMNRREYKDDEPVHPGIVASSSRSSVSATLERSYLSHYQSQSAPRPSSTSRRSSDPVRAEYRLSESPYFSPPPSTQSIHPDAYASSPYPPPPPHTQPLLSSPPPHQSSPLLFDSQAARRPSQSPVLGLRPAAAAYSPTSTYRVMSQTSPFANPSGPAYSPLPPSHSQNPMASSSSASPNQEPFTPRSSHFRSSSFAQPEMPLSTPRSTSSAALPNLLNADPSRSPVIGQASRGSPGGFGGLEALVQAATEERRRLSGEHPTLLESARKASLSPVVNRVPPPLPHPAHSPVLQKSPALPSPRFDTRVNSLAVIPLGPRSSHDGEPPSKRRRRTGSFGNGQPPTPASASAASLRKHDGPSVPPPLPRSPPPTSGPSEHSSPPVALPAEPPAVPKRTSISQLLSPEPARRSPPRATADFAIQPQPPVPLPPVPVLAPATAPVAREEQPVMVQSHIEEAPTSMPNPAFENEGVRMSESPDTARLVKEEEPEEPEEPGESTMREFEEESSIAAPPPQLQSPPTMAPALVQPEDPSIPAPLDVQVELSLPPPAGVADAPMPVDTTEPTEQDVSQIVVAEPRVVSPVEAEIISEPATSQVESPPFVEAESLPAVADAAIVELASLSPVPSQEDQLPPQEEILSSEPVAQSMPQAAQGVVTPPDSPIAEQSEAPRPSMAVTEDVPAPLASIGEEAPEPTATDARELSFPPEPPAPDVVMEVDVPAPLVDIEKAEVDEEVVLPPGPKEDTEDVLSDTAIRPDVEDNPVATPEVRGDCEQDAHEWLLEQFGDASGQGSRHTSVAPEEPPQTPYLSEVSPPHLPDDDAKPGSPSTGPAASKLASPSRSPTPTALLEQELDDISPDDAHKAAPSPRSEADTDFASELDLAASITPDHEPDGDISMTSELDDELLSLVGDKPRSSHAHAHHASTGKVSQPPLSKVKDDEAIVVKAPAPKIPSLEPSRLVGAPSATPGPPSERLVMPPPIAPPSQASKSEQQTATKVDQSSKGEDASTSADKNSMPSKAKQATKAKTKPMPRPKVKGLKEKDKDKEREGTAGSTGCLTPSGSGTVVKGKKTTAGSAMAAKRAVSAAVGPSRSRSTSEMPPEPTPKPRQPQEDEADAEEEDDKLYCICKTSYDEDRVMIACDLCDEWYHTQCLGIDDLEVDLIDQFVCPLCIRANPNLPLKTTYKQRCMAGLKHPHPSSAAACHKPSRGAFSKFCSDECGITYMQRRIEGWGGDQAVLWASVKDTKQREGVVVQVRVVGGQANGALVQEAYEVKRPVQTQRERKIARLQAELDKLVGDREQLKQELDITIWRQKLLALAVRRKDALEDECGWDQRLCLDEEDYAEFSAGVLEGYEEPSGGANGYRGDGMEVDAAGVEEGEWWCQGGGDCQRHHAGWHKLRASEYEFDRELKEKRMMALTSQEREIRKQLEDALSLPEHSPIVSVAPAIALNGHSSTNGAKPKQNGTSGKKGKQKK